MQVLSPEECRRFLESIEGIRQDALFTLALVLGPRRGELLGLKERDVDPDARRLVVGAALQRVTGLGPQLLETKTARGRRVVTLPRICVRALRAQRIQQVQDKLLSGAGWRETGFVFTNRNGGPLDGDRVSEQFKKALNDAGLPEVRFHDLRHGAPSLLLMQGVPSCVVMDVLGHSQIAVTLNTYTHVMPSLVDEAAKAMDRALGSGSAQ